MKQVIHTDSAPKAVGPYSQAVMSGNVVFTSGQLGVDMQTGKLAESTEDQARNAMKYLGEVLSAAGLTYENIVKATIFMTDLADFSNVNAIYQSFFPSDFPARSCVQVAALPLGASVEIECIAIP